MCATHTRTHAHTRLNVTDKHLSLQVLSRSVNLKEAHQTDIHLSPSLAPFLFPCSVFSQTTEITGWCFATHYFSHTFCFLERLSQRWPSRPSNLCDLVGKALKVISFQNFLQWVVSFKLLSELRVGCQQLLIFLKPVSNDQKAN